MNEGRSGVLLAVSDPELRTAIRASLELDGRNEVVDDAATDREALALLASGVCRPRVVVLDLTAQEMGGLETVRRIKEQHPDIRVMVLLADDVPRLLADAFAEDLSGYLVRGGEPAHLANAVSLVVDHAKVFDARLTKAWFDWSGPQEHVAPLTIPNEMMTRACNGSGRRFDISEGRGYP